MRRLALNQMPFHKSNDAAIWIAGIIPIDAATIRLDDLQQKLFLHVRQLALQRLIWMIEVAWHHSSLLTRRTGAWSNSRRTIAARSSTAFLVSTTRWK